jgi:hypothetical protein
MTLAMIRQLKDDEAIPILIGKELRFTPPLGQQTYRVIQPDELDDEEFNILVWINCEWVRAKSIDFNFINRRW